MGLDPIASLVCDETAMNVLRLESHIASATSYLARLKEVVSRIYSTLWPEAPLQNDLESLMTRLNEIPDRVQEWKKSSAQCGANVALSLVRVHCKEVREDKLAAIKVANTKKHDFQSFMETFMLPPLGSLMGSIWTHSWKLPVLLGLSEQSYETWIRFKFASECRVVSVTVKLLRAWCLSTFDSLLGTF